jgi:hypothetical protein
MACAPCAKMRAAAMKAAGSGDMTGAMKIVAAGAAAMTGVISKEAAVAYTETIVPSPGPAPEGVEAPNVKRYGETP